MLKSLIKFRISEFFVPIFLPGRKNVFKNAAFVYLDDTLHRVRYPFHSNSLKEEKNEIWKMLSWQKMKMDELSRFLTNGFYPFKKRQPWGIRTCVIWTCNDAESLINKYKQLKSRALKTIKSLWLMKKWRPIFIFWLLFCFFVKHNCPENI